MSREPIKATEGMIYTNGETYGEKIFLGTGDSPDNWWEITKAEYQSMIENSLPTDGVVAEHYRRYALR